MTQSKKGSAKVNEYAPKNLLSQIFEPLPNESVIQLAVTTNSNF